MYRFRHARGFPAEQQHVLRSERVLDIGHGPARGEENEPEVLSAPPRVERIPGDVPHQRDLLEIIHAGAAEGAIRHRKSRRFDDVRFDSEAGAQPQNGRGVRGNVGLKQRDPRGGEEAHGADRGLVRTTRCEPVIDESAANAAPVCGLRSAPPYWACTIGARVPIERRRNEPRAAFPQGRLRPVRRPPRERPLASRFAARSDPPAREDWTVTTTSSAQPTRRDFLFIATGAAGAAAGAASIWPLISQMNPDQSTIAAGAPLEVDLSPIAEGQVIKVF